MRVSEIPLFDGETFEGTLIGRVEGPNGQKNLRRVSPEQIPGTGGGGSGEAGPQGPAGPAGPAGADGAAGPAGADGAQGPQGIQGIQGIQGPAGTNGTNGANGADGADGADGPEWVPVHSTLTQASPTQIDFNGDDYKTLTLSGDLVLEGINHAATRNIVVRIIADASARTITFPVTWKFLGDGAPPNIAASKVGLLSLTCFGGAEADVIAAYAVENP